jgi:2-oxoglutarate dehydrogenase E2 component (dihydrolipoamide succinyltransferase)
VLVNASKSTAGSSSAASSGDCSSATASGSGEAYELGGSREKDLASYVGKRVEITGTLKAAKTDTSSAGEPKPTGGFDPLKQDLKLFEVDVVSFRPVSSSQSAGASSQAAAAPAPERSASAPAAQTPAAPAAQPAPAPRPAAPATPSSQQSTPPTAPRQNLPRTASPLPLMGLFGLLSMATGLMLRRRG